MVTLTSKNIRVLALGSVLVTIGILLFLIFEILYMISTVLTIPGTLMLFILGLWILLRQAVQILIFPGASWF